MNSFLWSIQPLTRKIGGVDSFPGTMENSFRYTSNPIEKEKVAMIQKWIRSDKAQRAKALVFEAADGNTHRGVFVSQSFAGRRVSNEPESAGGVIVIRGDAGEIRLDALDIIAWWIH